MASAYEFLKPGAQHKIIKLFIKTFGAMMLRLIPNISPRTFEICFAHRSRKIFFLPREFCLTKLLFVDPMRRLALDQLHRFTNRLINTERNQTVHVVNISANEINVNIFLSCILANVFENLVANFFGQIRFSVFC